MTRAGGAPGGGPDAPRLVDLLRHGAAAPAAAGGDDERPLAPEGRESIVRLADALAAAAERPRLAFSSPLRRARETAAIVTARLGIPAAEVLEELLPESEPGALAAALAARAPAASHLLLVGHQPLMGRLARHWSPAEARFAPGQLHRFALDAALRPGSGRRVLSIPSEGELSRARPGV